MIIFVGPEDVSQLTGLDVVKRTRSSLDDQLADEVNWLITSTSWPHGTCQNHVGPRVSASWLVRETWSCPGRHGHALGLTRAPRMCVVEVIGTPVTPIASRLLGVMGGRAMPESDRSRGGGEALEALEALGAPWGRREGGPGGRGKDGQLTASGPAVDQLASGQLATRTR